MVKRGILVLLLLAGTMLSACGGSDFEKENAKEYTIGILMLGNSFAPTFNGFKTGLTELGYVENEHVTYVFDGPIAAIDDLEAATNKLIAEDVDLIFCSTTAAALAAKKAAEQSKTPVVFAPLTNPVEAGVIESITEPGGHVTGVYTGLTEGRRMQYATEIAPDAKNYYILYNPEDLVSVGPLKVAQETAQQLGITLILAEATNADELTQELDTIPDEIEVFYMIPGSTVASHFGEIQAMTVERKIILVVPALSFVNHGGLMGYGLEFEETGQQAARLADQILKGANPAELPAEQAESYLGINLVTADAIDLDVDDATLRKADTIIRAEAE